MSSDMVHKPIVFVGYTAVARGNPEDYLERPSPPSNYGDEAKANWQETKGAEMWRKAVCEASFRKMSGRPEQIYAIAPQDKEVFTFSGEDSSRDFMRMLRKLKYCPQDTVFFGFGAREFLRISGPTAVLSGEDVPRGYWYQHEEVYDPYEMLTEEPSRKHLTAATVLAQAGVSVPETWREPHVNAELDAALAFQLTLQMQLLPDCVDATKLQKQVVQVPKMPVAVAPVETK